jgi:hypothetical protein
VKSYCQDHLLLLRDLLDATDFVRDEIADDDLRGDLYDAGVEAEEASSTIALRMQTTGGNPSSILSHVRPSSLEPNSFPLRVPK